MRVPSIKKSNRLGGVVAALAFLYSATASEVFDLSLEELLNISVESVSGSDDNWWRAPAAVTVISHEDIRNMGETSLPEILRHVPGLHVAHSESSVWSVTARGFPSRFANKLLVLVDGRSIYNPLFAGVYWDTQQLPIDSIERIEVIRGPGATLWGSNAVNGVINVITKHTDETIGSHAEISAGSYEQGAASYRYGSRTESGSYRIWVDTKRFDNLANTAGQSHNDTWDMHAMGFRTDHQLADEQTLQTSGGIYGSDSVDQRLVYFDENGTMHELKEAQQHYGGHFLVKWKSETSATKGMQIQSFGDVSVRDTHLLNEQRMTWDLELRRWTAPTQNQKLMWGVGYRLTHDELNDSFAVGFNPNHKTRHKLSAFIQDEITLSDTLALSLGTKYEYNEEVDHEWQPGIRLAWTPTARHTLWASATRAVRVPARVDQDYEAVSFFIGPNPSGAYGDPDAPSEELLAYELGYRQALTTTTSIDVNLFYNEYDDLSVFNAQGFDRVRASTLRGETYGTEATLRWRPHDRIQFDASYTFLQIQLHGTIESDESRSPQNQAAANLHVELSERTSLHAHVGYVDAIDTLRTPIDAYIRADLGLRWKVNNHCELSVWGRNLLDDAHSEFDDPQNFERSEVERSVLIRFSANF